MQDVDGGALSVPKYRVWRSLDPYFAPSGDPYREVLAPDPLPPAITFTDAGVLANTDLNYYYIVRAVSAAGLSSSDSNRTAEFGFPLVKGS